MLVIDAKGAIAGRLSAFVAKKLLEHEDVVIVNAEKAVISGKPREVVDVYRRRLTMTDKANPELGAKWPRRPDLMLRRIIRGMLPKRAYRQATALKRLRVHMGQPAGVENGQAFGNQARDLSDRFIELGQVCAELGWTPHTLPAAK
ncbi:50S ribosomal protein L13 [Candidatus Micrarchaeota archaeon]|nr:50S ribosomal protein L13 [Candidatus Micrarchaeota archaeon]